MPLPNSTDTTFVNTKIFSSCIRVQTRQDNVASEETNIYYSTKKELIILIIYCIHGRRLAYVLFYIFSVLRKFCKLHNYRAHFVINSATFVRFKANNIVYIKKATNCNNANFFVEKALSGYNSGESFFPFDAYFRSELIEVQCKY